MIWRWDAECIHRFTMLSAVPYEPVPQAMFSPTSGLFA